MFVPFMLTTTFSPRLQVASAPALAFFGFFFSGELETPTLATTPSGDSRWCRLIAR